MTDFADHEQRWPDPPEPEEFSVPEMKLLTMMLLENRGNMDFAKGLTPHGEYIFAGLQRKLAINVLGIDAGDVFGVPAIERTCPACGTALEVQAQEKSLLQQGLTK